MKFDIPAIFEEFVSFFVRLPFAQKVALPLLLAGSIGLIVFVTRWGGRPDYRVLFSNLEESDASGIVDYLKEKKIGYRLRDDGSTIEVTPPALVHDVRLELASSGLPKGKRVGFEVFNEAILGQTGFGERVNYQRALQGEVERTILSIEAVRSVRVHITNPERSVFVKRDVAPTASVLLRLKPGSELTKPQIKGISHLVSGCVERLTPENVTIMDSQGNMLSEKREKDDLKGADLARLEYQREIEAAYVKRIETMLSEILGPGRAVARVSAEMDFNSMEREEESYDPAGVVKRSEREVEEGAGVTANGGVPGVMSNLTNDPALLTPPDGSKNANVRKEAVRNYEVSRSVSRSSQAAGRIVKLSAAVLVDGQYELASGAKEMSGPAAERIYKPLSAEMMRKIDNLVRQAIGFDNTRGDEVTVENIRFAEVGQELEEELKSAENWEMFWKVSSYLGPALFILFFFLIVVKPLIAFLVSPTESEIDLSRLLPAGIEELEAELEAERAKVSTMPDMAAPVVDIEELEALLAENSRICRESPQQAALLIRYWLNDGRV